MAQYTKVLASEYNAMQYKVQDILGARQGVPSSYGYNNAGLINSSPVAVGQKITPTEWANLRKDLDTLYYYQYSTTSTTYANVVSNNSINWANVVSFQTVTNDVDSKSQSFSTYYSGGTLGSYTNLSNGANTSYTRAAGWGGTGGLKNIEVNGTLTFTDRQTLQAFFNAGGRIYLSVTTAGTVSGSGTKDYAYNNIISLANQIWLRADWWSYGGSNGTSATQTKTATASGAGYTPYGSTTGDLTIRTQLSYNGNNVIGFNFKATDGTNQTSSGYTSPTIGLDTTVQLSVLCPGGYTPPAGVGVISVPNPTNSNPTFSTY